MKNKLKIVGRDCITNSNIRGVKSSEFDDCAFIALRENIDRFIKSIGNYLNIYQKVLEIGPSWEPYCGVREVYSSKFKIDTLDIDPKSNPTYCADITKETTIDKGYYDIIVCLDVLEHTINPFFAINEITRILAKNGLLFISIPCNYRIHSPLPDSWRITEHGLKVILEYYNYEILELKCIESTERLLFPIHYTCIAKKNV